MIDKRIKKANSEEFEGLKEEETELLFRRKKAREEDGFFEA